MFEHRCPNNTLPIFYKTGKKYQGAPIGCRCFLEAEFVVSTRRAPLEVHQPRLETDSTSIALAVLSQRVAIFFFADDRFT